MVGRRWKARGCLRRSGGGGEDWIEDSRSVVNVALCVVYLVDEKSGMSKKCVKEVFVTNVVQP